MIYSENPYIDILIYYTKILGIGTVLKIDSQANFYETEESFRNAEMMIMCHEGICDFEFFDQFSESVLRKAGLTGMALYKAMHQKDEIPKAMRDTVVKLAQEEFMENYEDLNYYYRMLAGLPPVGMQDFVENWYPPNGIKLDITKPIHKMNSDEIRVLNTYGVLRRMYEEDKHNRAYMLYMDRKIDTYVARRTSNFGVLYIPTVEQAEIEKEYRDRLEVNKLYVLKAVYSDAYAYDSDYYDNIMAILIVLNAMMDVILRVQEFIARKEVFDLRTCSYIFESFGVDFFPTIPLRYQVKMVKRLHTLLKFKSTTRCMIEICDIFGMKNIKIFKHYLLKNRKYSKVEGNYSFTGDNDKDFDLKFVKIPVDEPMAKYIRDPAYHEPYDQITQEYTWDGGLDHHDVKKQHYDHNYNYSRTKYISIESVYDIAKISAQNSYFFNMLYDNYELEDLLLVDLPMISSEKRFKLADVFTFMACVAHYYYGRKDLIMDTQGKVLYVNGFNFRADLAQLAEALDQLQHVEEARELLDKFNLPTTSIPSINQLMKIFVNNLEVKDLLVAGMRHADSKQHYEPFKKLYDALMTVELTMDHFKNPETGDFYRDGDGDATYLAYLQNADPVLAFKVMELLMIDDEETRQTTIVTLIDNICYRLEEWIDMDEFQGLFKDFPGVSIDAIKQYVMMVVCFYLSYKAQLLGINTIYYFDDPEFGYIQLLDEVILRRFFEKDEVIHLLDKLCKLKVKLEPKDKIDLVERIWLDVSTWKYHTVKDYIFLRDIIDTFFIRYNKDDILEMPDHVHLKDVLELETAAQLIDFIEGFRVTMAPKDEVHFVERIWINRTSDPLANAILINPNTGEIKDNTGNLLWPREDQPGEVMFNILNIVVPAKASQTVMDSRIRATSTASFYLDATLGDMADGITCECFDGKVIVSNPGKYDIYGLIHISR